MGEKAFNFEPEFLVTSAGFDEIRGAVGGIALSRRVIDLFEALPAVRVHDWYGILT